MSEPGGGTRIMRNEQMSMERNIRIKIVETSALCIIGSQKSAFLSRFLWEAKTNSNL